MCRCQSLRGFDRGGACMIDIYKIWDEASVCGCTMRRMVVVQGFVHPEAIKNLVRQRTRTVRNFHRMF